MAKKDGMFWVAADPSQPGAAFAACADEPRYEAENEETKADWIERGAEPKLVDADTMRQMLSAWKLPGQMSLA